MCKLNCENELLFSELSNSLNFNISNSTSSSSGNSKENSVSPPKVFSTNDETLSESLFIISLLVSAYAKVVNRDKQVIKINYLRRLLSSPFFSSSLNSTYPPT